MLHWSQTQAGAVAVNMLKLKYIDRVVGEVCSAVLQIPGIPYLGSRELDYFYTFTNMVASYFRDKQLQQVNDTACFLLFKRNNSNKHVLVTIASFMHEYKNIT